MADVSREQALASLKGFLSSGAYSDLTITCGSDTYKVHKVIVRGRAAFFARAERFGGQESQCGTIDLPEDEPAIVKLLVQYLYEGEYEPLLPATDCARTLHSAAAKTERPTKDDFGNIYSYDFPHSCSSQYACIDVFICPHHECGWDGCGCGFTC